MVRLRLLLKLERGRPAVLSIRTGRPTRDIEALQRLIKARLESVRIDAPMEELVIEVEESAPDLGWQPGPIGPRPMNHSMSSQLVSRMA